MVPFPRGPPAGEFGGGLHRLCPDSGYGPSIRPEQISPGGDMCSSSALVCHLISPPTSNCAPRDPHLRTRPEHHFIRQSCAQAPHQKTSTSTTLASWVVHDASAPARHAAVGIGEDRTSTQQHHLGVKSMNCLSLYGLCMSVRRRTLSYERRDIISHAHCTCSGRRHQ